MKYISLPLYNSQDYFYTVTLENVSCKLRIYYNQRVDGWFYELSEEGGNMLVAGERLVALYPMILDYTSLPFTGFLWLEPIGTSGTKFTTDSYNLHKWFRLFYITEQ